MPHPKPGCGFHSTALSNHPHVIQKLIFQPRLRLRARHAHVCQKSGNGLVTVSQMEHGEGELELTKSLVTEGLHLLLLCEVVCRGREDTGLTCVAWHVGAVWDPAAAIPSCSLPSFTMMLPHWLSFCSCATPHFLRKTTGSLPWLFPLLGMFFCTLCDSF